MNSTIKSVLVLLVTLGIGIAIGAMVWATVHNMQMERIRSLRDRGALSRRIEEVVVPQDSTQSRQIQAIVATHESRLSDIYHESSRAIGNAVDSLRVQLGVVLDDDQLTRLDNWLRESRRSGSRNGSRNSSRQEDSPQEDQ